MRNDWMLRPIGEVLRQVQRPVSVAGVTVVPFAGVRWHAEGVYHRDDVPAADVKTKTLNRIEAGDVVYNRMWATKASFGVVRDDATGCLVTSDFPVFTATPEVLVDFLALLFGWEPFQVAAASAATGTTERRRLSEREFVKLRLPIPPLVEQRRIVDLIGALDDTIAAAKSASSRSAYDATLAAMMATPGGDPLSKALRLRRDGQAVQPATEYRILGVLRSGEGFIDRGSIRGHETGYTRLFQVGADELVYRKLTAWEGPISVSTDAESGGWVSPEFPIFSIDQTVLRPGLMRHFCRWPGFWQLIGDRLVGSVQRRKRLNPEALLGIEVPMPPLEVQDAWLVALDAWWEVVAAGSVTVLALRRTRSDLLAALLSGEHVIPDSYDELMGVAS